MNETPTTQPSIPASSTPADSTMWSTFAAQAPELAAQAASRFLATKHHVIGTLRLDGSPRLSGTEVQLHREHLAVGFMHGSVKAIDLRRDPRCAVHSNPGDGTMDGGDVKLSAFAHEVTDAELLATYVEAVQPPPPFHLFTLALRSVSVCSIHPDGDRMVIATWRPGAGVHIVERA